ncbi:MAG TPA: VCBS repeat-containing protein [Pirellulaceae bacterium]|nr:VCBS repeat-containing protein [Pirellulaceae bacterium]
MVRSWLRILATVAVTSGLFAGLADAQDAKKITFKKAQLDPIFRSEGVAVGDFNKDGKNDIAAGYVWYAAPDWKMHSIIEKAPEYNPNGYANSFCTFALDVNHDEWLDIVVVDFPGTPTWWFENPKEAGKLWTKHTLTPVTNNESPAILDTDGDGKQELLFAFSPDPKNTDGPDRQVGFAKPQSDVNAEWKLFPVSEKNAPGAQRYSHGIGSGDVNKDGRNDVIIANGWWEAPVERDTTPWKWHPANFDCGGGAAQMFAYDFDGDGDNDILGTSPHGLGMYWFEQTEAGKFAKHEIDKSFSQTHGVCFVDMNGDGLMDFVTGKRYWAHGPKGDVDPGAPAILAWYELKREGGKPSWIKHQIDHDSGVGTQFEVADVNGDKLLDVVVSNKKGVFYFEQVRE